MQRTGIFAKVVEKHRAAAPRRDVLRDARDRAVRVWRFEDGGKEIGCETAESLACNEVFGHSLKVLVYRRGIAKTQRLEVRARLILREVRRKEEI